MTQYNTLNVKLSNSRLDKLNLGIKKGTEVTLDFSSNVIGDSNDETNFPRKLFLTDTQVSKICKAFGNGSSAIIKLSKTQLPKVLQSGSSIFDLLGLTDPFGVVTSNVYAAKKYRI